MRADFRREHQIVWGLAEAMRLRNAFGHAARITDHVVDNVFTRGGRLLTLSDPDTKGVAGAICITSRSEEGSLWTAELFPLADDDAGDIPLTKSIQAVTLQMRYGTCVHATSDRVLGRRSGEGGVPDFADGVARLLRGDVVLHRRWHVLSDHPEPYARLAS